MSIPTETLTEALPPRVRHQTARRNAFRQARSLTVVIALLLAGCADESAEPDSATPAQTASTQVEVPATTHPDTSGDEWKDLFAEDLSGAIDSAGVWRFEEGQLTASEDEAIFTEEEYDDYILDLEVKTSPGANSGVILHASDTDNWIPNSIEVQIGDDYQPESTEPPSHGASGAFYGHVAPSKQTIKPAGEWNRYTITAKGDSLWVVLNGELVSEIDMSEYNSADVNPDGTEIPEWLSTPLAELPTEGHIGLQGKHGDSPIWFRNIKIRELD